MLAISQNVVMKLDANYISVRKLVGLYLWDCRTEIVNINFVESTKMTCNPVHRKVKEARGNANSLINAIQRIQNSLRTDNKYF